MLTNQRGRGRHFGHLLRTLVLLVRLRLQHSRGAIDARVEHEHDDQHRPVVRNVHGQVDRGNGRERRVALLLGHRAIFARLADDGVVAEYGHGEQQRRRDPDGDDDDDTLLRSS